MEEAEIPTVTVGKTDLICPIHGDFGKEHRDLQFLIKGSPIGIFCADCAVTYAMKQLEEGGLQNYA